MEKAYLCEVKSPGSRVSFHFNPTTIKFSKSAQFKRAENQKGKTGPPVQFVSTSPIELSIQLLLDAVGKGPTASVEPEVTKLMSWTAPDSASAKSKSPSPPLLQFTWGQLKLGTNGKFVGHLETVGVTYKMFSPNGAPIRADVDLKLKDVPQEPAGTNPTSGGLVTHRRRQITRGESLHSVAYAEYGDAALWRGLAVINEIDDPLRVAPGRTLLVPEEAELRRFVADVR